MSYITSALLPYRSKNVGEEFIEILEDDYEWICHSFKERGFIFLIAVIVLMSMSLLKAIVHVLTQLRKPKMTYEHLDLHRGMREETITDILTRREAVDEVQNHDNLCPNDNVKKQRVESINSLRDYLYRHDLTLQVTVLKTINHRRTEEEMLEMCKTGAIIKPLTTTYITFGDAINKLLKEILGDSIDLRKDRFSNETRIVILNNDYFPIKEQLQNLYNETIRIKFD